MLATAMLCLIWLSLSVARAANNDWLDVDIDISTLQNEAHDSGQFHESDLLRFFLPNGAILCQLKLHGTTDSKCRFDKKALKSGPNEIYNAVFTQEANGKWIELENSRATVIFNNPSGFHPSPKSILAYSLSAIAVVSGSKYFIDFTNTKPVSRLNDENPLKEDPHPTAFPPEDVCPASLSPEENIWQENFPAKSDFALRPSALPKQSQYQSKMQYRTIGALFGVAFGVGSIAANRNHATNIPIQQSFIEDFPSVEQYNWDDDETEEELVATTDAKPDILTRIKKNAGALALFILAQGLFILKRPGRRMRLGKWGEIVW